MVDAALPDTSRILQTSREFYTAHNMPDWAENLPAVASLTGEAQSILEKAHAGGFTLALAFPSPAVQSASLAKLLHEMGGAPVEGLPKEHQYTEPFLPIVDEMQAAPAKNRPDAPYILLSMPGPFPTETRGKQVPELNRLFAAMSWNGLTVAEYIVLQRRSVIEHRDHRFDDYAKETIRSQWTWLLDTHVPSGCAAAYWNPGKRRLEIYACKAGSKNERRGAHPTIIIPLTAE